MARQIRELAVDLGGWGTVWVNDFWGFHGASGVLLAFAAGPTRLFGPPRRTCRTDARARLIYAIPRRFYASCRPSFGGSRRSFGPRSHAGLVDEDRALRSVRPAASAPRSTRQSGVRRFQDFAAELSALGGKKNWPSSPRAPSPVPAATRSGSGPRLSRARGQLRGAFAESCTRQKSANGGHRANASPASRLASPHNALQFLFFQPQQPWRGPQQRPCRSRPEDRLQIGARQVLHAVGLRLNRGDRQRALALLQHEDVVLD